MSRWLPVAGLICLDWLSKAVAQQWGWVVFNPGISFGLGVWPLFTWIHGGLCVLVGVCWYRFRSPPWLTWVLAAGIGNGLDRLMFGGVRDFIRYPGVGLVGNLADIYLVWGVWLALRSYNTHYVYGSHTRSL